MPRAGSAKSIDFVSRSQNLATPENTTALAGKVNDGGFYYTIAGGGSMRRAKHPTADCEATAR